MGKHTGNYMQQAKRCMTPAVVFGIAVEKEESPSANSLNYREATFKSVAACVSKKRNGRWSYPLCIETEDCEALRNWMMEHADPRLKNYVIAPVASDVLTLTQWWGYAERKGIRLAKDNEYSGLPDTANVVSWPINVRRCILRSTPDIFDYRDETKRFIWLSGAQYFSSPEESLSEHIGFKRSSSLFDESTVQGGALQGIDRAILWSQLLMQLSNWWAENAKAAFGLTIGGLAMGILRTHTKPKTLCTHDDEYSHKLERLACYGGRSSLWFVGGIGNPPTLPLHWRSKNGRDKASLLSGPARLCDIRSMYPHLLRECMFPVRRIGRIGSIPATELQSLASYYGVIAKVTIYSDSGEYPYRAGERITYPRGYFSTILTGPELKSIQGKDKIVLVHDGTYYHLDKPFQKAAQALLDMRLKARAEKRSVWEYFAKAVGNNLGGKLAQKKAYWKPRPDVPAQRDWGQWFESNHDTGVATRFEAKAGMVFEYVKDDGGYGPYTASFAYLTAYGRLLMRTIRHNCPAESVISQDTDGIWVLGDDAFRQLSGKFAFGNDPGQLTIKEFSQSALFLSPRHYWTDNGWTLAGFTSQDVDTERMEVRDTQSINPATIGARETPTKLLTRLRLSKLKLDHVGGEIMPDGWVRPLWIPPPKDWD